MKKILLFFVPLCLLFFNSFLSARNFYSVSSGTVNWGTAASWTSVPNCSCAPTPANVATGDNIFINTTVKFDSNYVFTRVVYITVNNGGSIGFAGNQDIELPEGSVINLATSGSLIQGNTGSQRITIGGVLQYKGNGAGAPYIGNVTGTALLPAGATVILPITLVSFTAKATNEGINIAWQTSYELNNALFIVEKSINGYDFSPIYETQGENLVGGISKYSFMDAEYLSYSVLYYRLVQIDTDGKTTYSKIVKIGLSEPFTGSSSIHIYPNEVKSGNILQINIPNYQTPRGVMVRLYDTNGRILQQAENILDKDEDTIHFTIEASLSVGIYFINVTTDTTTSTQKIYIY
jgi:hypothetical protein